MHLVAIGLVGLLVVYLATKSPDVNTNANTQSVPPNNNIPALGTVGNPSPAMSGGSPMASQLFRTAAQVNAPLVGTNTSVAAPGTVRQLNASAGTFSAPSATVAEMSKALMTITKPPLVTSTTNPSPLSKYIKL